MKDKPLEGKISKFIKSIKEIDSCRDKGEERTYQNLCLKCEYKKKKVVNFLKTKMWY